MKKLPVYLTALIIILCACQKEPDFTPVDQPTAAKAMSDTVKAVVFDGSLYPSVPQLDYDSLVYNLKPFGATITHYARPGTFMWQELFDYDARGRVTHYTFTDIAANYRHCHFSYTVSDSFPSAVVDSFTDGELTVDLLNRVAATATAAGTTYTYRLRYDVPGTGYNESYNVKYAFNTTGRLVSAESDSFYLQRREGHFYTADGLLDSTHTTAYAASYADSNDAKITYTNFANPLAPLGRLVYKNLYGFLSSTIGLYSYHFSLSNEYTALYAARLPQSAVEFVAGHAAFESYTYSYRLQGTVLKAMGIQVFEDGYTPSTTTVAVRIY